MRWLAPTCVPRTWTGRCASSIVRFRLSKSHLNGAKLSQRRLPFEQKNSASKMPKWGVGSERVSSYSKRCGFLHQRLSGRSRQDQAKVQTQTNRRYWAPWFYRKIVPNWRMLCAFPEEPELAQEHLKEDIQERTRTEQGAPAENCSRRSCNALERTKNASNGGSSQFCAG